MKFMKLKMLDHPTLVRLNQSSSRAGRRQRLPPELLAKAPQTRYPINLAIPHQRDGQEEVRMSVMLDAAGQTAWLDVSAQEFSAIPEAEVIFDVWEGVMCAGNPPPAP